MFWYIYIYIVLDMEGSKSNDVRASFLKERKQCFYQSQVTSNIATDQDAGYEEDDACGFPCFNYQYWLQTLGHRKCSLQEHYSRCFCCHDYCVFAFIYTLNMGVIFKENALFEHRCTFFSPIILTAWKSWKIVWHAIQPH